MEATRSSLSGHSLQLRAVCRKHWLSVRKEGLVSLADGAASARDPTAPSALADPGLVLVRAPDRLSRPKFRGVGRLLAKRLGSPTERSPTFLCCMLKQNRVQAGTASRASSSTLRRPESTSRRLTG